MRTELCEYENWKQTLVTGNIACFTSCASDAVAPLLGVPEKILYTALLFVSLLCLDILVVPLLVHQSAGEALGIDMVALIAAPVASALRFQTSS